MKRILFIIIFSLGLNITLKAQKVIFQEVSGVVNEIGTGLPLEGVNILLKNSNLEKGTSSDKNGYFQFTDIPVGRYTIYFSHIGYQNKVQQDILVEAGKVKRIEISLTASPYELEELTITDITPNSDNFHLPSAYTFSIEQSQRFAATFYDPARMALSFPGVTSANDQANNISIRGNSPFANRWKIEGADVVNPNHLTNAGTMTDRVSIVGGGVSVLSAQLMGNTKLMTGAFPPNFGDALGGFMDVGLRKGNNKNGEYTLQAGLLGIDLAAEGPFSKNSDASYLVNYRYSTIGLLDAIGVEVSPEKINFQDLSFNISIPSKGNTEWGVFGLIGLSSEKFDAERDSAEWEFNEDRVDTKFTSDMGAIGVSNKILTGKKSSLNTVFAYSKIKADRQASFVDDNFTSIPIESDIYAQELISLNSTFNYNPNKRHSIFAGVTVNHTGYDVLSRAAPTPASPMLTTVSNNGNFQVLRAFGNWSPVLSPKIRGNIGAHLVYFNLNEEVSFEPRLGLDVLVSPRASLALNYGLVSQSHFPQVYFVNDSVTGSLPNQQLKLSKSHQLTLNYTYQINHWTTLSLDGYYQSHFNVPVSVDPQSTFSLLNAVDVYIDQQLVNEGTGKNYGAELMLNRTFKKGLYFVVSSSIYDATYQARDGIDRNARFNGSYSSTFTLGKEITRIKNDKNNITGFNLRFIWQGGYRHTPIDEDASANAGKTVYIEQEAFFLKYNDFIRADVRIYLKKNKEKYTRTLSLDIQNLTGRENIAYQYYDPYSNKVETKYQLGLLPFLTYRVEF